MATTKKEKKSAPVKKKKAPEPDQVKMTSFEEVILFAVNTVGGNLPQELKDALVRSLTNVIVDIDKEIQFIRDTRTRDFLRLHVEDKLVIEFLDSLSTVKIVDHLSSRSV